MPSHHHRRRIRTMAGRRFITKPMFLKGQEGESEVVQIQTYLTHVVNTIAQQNSISNTVSVLQGVIEQVKTRVDYYNVLDAIEEQVLSVLCNMADSVSPGIIKLRLECVRNSIQQLPIEGPEYGTKEMHDMLFHILDLIMNGMSLSGIVENISQLQRYTLEAYNQNALLTQIQLTILDIICNISQGTPTGIIACRIDFLKGLISKLELV